MSFIQRIYSYFIKTKVNYLEKTCHTVSLHSYWKTTMSYLTAQSGSLFLGYMQLYGDPFHSLLIIPGVALTLLIPPPFCIGAYICQELLFHSPIILYEPTENSPVVLGLEA